MEATEDGWIEWGGGDCPVDANMRVDVKIRGRDELGTSENTRKAMDFRWGHNHPNHGPADDIIAYRAAKLGGE